MVNREAAIAAIRTCKTMDDFDYILDLHKIEGVQETLDCLNEAMYSPQIFKSTPIDDKDELEFTKEIFLTGTWRLKESYDRIKTGLVAANG